MDIVILYRKDFDILENYNPYIEEEIGVFGPKDNLSAYGNCSEFLNSMNPVKMYLGYDGEIYPKFRMVRKTLK